VSPGLPWGGARSGWQEFIMAATIPRLHLVDHSDPPATEMMLEPVQPIFETARPVTIRFDAELPMGLATDYDGAGQPTIWIDPVWWVDTPAAERRQVVVEAIVHHMIGTAYRLDRLGDDIAPRRVLGAQAAERALAAHLPLLPNLGALLALCRILSHADGAWLDRLAGEDRGAFA
jgi:hypothetical protein